MIEHFISLFLTLPGWWVAGIVFTLALIECSLFFGFVFPAEIAVILAGVLCSRGTVSLWQAIPAAVLGAIIGDTIGYELGSRFGGPFLERKLGGRWTMIQSALQRRGAAMVFFGRFSAFLRATIPSAAGAVGIPYREFLFWNASGGIIWGTGYTLLGYYGGESFHAVLAYAGDAGWIILGVIAVVIIARIVWHRLNPRSKTEKNITPSLHS